MDKELKYKQLIENQGITGLCPDKDVLESSIEAFRWCTEPVNDIINFLPNIKEDEARKRPPRRLKGDSDKCGFCAISFFSSLNAAKNRFMSLGNPIKLKLGYTHVAKGVLAEGDGLLTPIKHDHFMLFEYQNVDLSTRFSIIENL